MNHYFKSNKERAFYPNGFFDICLGSIKKNKLLLIILIIGFILRLLPILWGVPIDAHVQNYHPDEPKVIRSILNFPWIYFSTETFMGYGTFIQYTFGLLFLPLKLVFKIFGLQENYNAAVIILSRLGNVIIGTASIYLTYRLALKIFNKKAALISAILLSVSFYHTMNSAVMTLDAAMGFILLVNFILSFSAAKKNNLKAYILLGIATGMLISIKITGVLFFLIPIILVLLSIKNISIDLSKQKFLFQQLKNIGVYVLTAIIIFLLFNPHVYLDPAKYLNFYLTEQKDWVQRTSLSLGSTIVKWITSTSSSIGFPITILFAVGILTIRKRNFRMQIILIIFLLLYYAFWRWFIHPRYIITVTPIICIIAAGSVEFFLSKKNKAIRIAALGILLFAIGYSAFLCISGIILRLDDTRPDASRFIELNVEEGSTLGIGYISPKYSWEFHKWRYPKIDFRKYKEVDFLKEPDILILNSYDFKPIIETLNSNKIDSNFVLGKQFYKEWYRYSPPSPDIFRFYDKIFNQHSDYVLLKSFKKNINVDIEFPPPEIRIYKRIDKTELNK